MCENLVMNNLWLLSAMKRLQSGYLAWIIPVLDRNILVYLL